MDYEYNMIRQSTLGMTDKQAMSKSLTTNKVFGEVAKELGFNGSGMTRFIEFPTYYLLINHQKSVYSKRFFVNVGLIYKELLDHDLSEEKIEGAYKLKDSTTHTHVDFRIEDFPMAPENLQQHFDSLVKADQIGALREVLSDAFSKLLTFIKDNHDRKTIRRLQDEKKLSAMVRKEV